MVESAGFFALDPEDAKRLQPYALTVFNNWRTNLLRQVPQLSGLDIDTINVDIATYLNDEEKLAGRRDLAVIVGGLKECTVTRPEYLPHIYTGQTIIPMFNITSLLEKVYERKLAQAREERRQQEEEARKQQRKREEEERRRTEEAQEQLRKQEEEERWQAAYMSLKIPLWDSRAFLNPEECEQFDHSIIGAVYAYLEKGKEYLRDERAYDYSQWLSRIKSRREEQERKTTATAKAQEFSNVLKKEVNELILRLSPEKVSIKHYFDENIRDPRYTGYKFADLLTSGRKHGLDNTRDKAVGTILDLLVSDQFHRFITWKYRYSYFLLPSADYSHRGVSCLSFYFDVFAAIRAEIWLEPGETIFDDYTFHMRIKDEEDDMWTLETPEFLGYHYLILTPNDLDRIFWQTTPLVLIKGLLSSAVEPAGTTILEASEAEIVYKVENYERQVVIPVSFSSYLKGIGSIDQMLDRGIISQRVRDIVMGRMSELETQQQVSLPSDDQTIELKSKLPRKTSKKARAYELFRQGKGPGSPEVKALGLHKSTRYKYYQAWIADGRP